MSESPNEKKGRGLDALRALAHLVRLGWLSGKAEKKNASTIGRIKALIESSRRMARAVERSNQETVTLAATLAAGSRAIVEDIQTGTGYRRRTPISEIYQNETCSERCCPVCLLEMQDGRFGGLVCPGCLYQFVTAQKNA